MANRCLNTLEWEYVSEVTSGLHVGHIMSVMYCDLLRDYVELRNEDYLTGRCEVGCCCILVQK